jgi:outer membrane protein OmpA-like peptidoglycan-associated protein
MRPIILMALSAFCLCGTVWAQQDPAASGEAAKVLKGNEITEDAVAKALFPVHYRSLKLHPAAQLVITFVTGSAELTTEARSHLDVVARAMKRGDSTVRFIVEGHADPRGTVEGNLALSRARAETVRDYFAHAHGIDQARMMAVGKGSSELLDTANPIDEVNRRVTIVTNLD